MKDKRNSINLWKRERYTKKEYKMLKMHARIRAIVFSDQYEKLCRQAWNEILEERKGKNMYRFKIKF